jgi:hypothetical protein
MMIISLVWHFDPLSIRIQHIIELLIHFLQSVIDILFLLLSVFDVSEARIVENLLRKLVLPEKLKSVNVFFSDFLSLHIIPRVHRKEIFDVDLFR